MFGGCERSEQLSGGNELVVSVMMTRYYVSSTAVGVGKVQAWEPLHILLISINVPINLNEANNMDAQKA